MNAHKMFYRFIGVICIAPLFMLMLSHAVGAQENIPSIASAAISVKVSELQTLWSEAIQLLEQKKISAALRKLKEVDIKKAEQGFANLPKHSAVLIQQAYILKEEGHLAEALQLVEFAKQLSPDVAAVNFALAKFRFFINNLDVYGAGRELFFGLLLQFRDINAIAFYVNNILGVLVLTGLLAGSVFILFLFGYYRSAILFSYFKSLPIPLALVNIVGWIIIGVITLALGVFWGILALAAFVIPHVDPSSKRGLVGFLFLGSLLAGLLTAICISYTVFDGNYIQALRDISYGHYSGATVKTLQQRLKEHPDDAYAIFGLAYIASHTGNSRAAIAAYNDIPGTYPDRAAVQNNLGNLYNHEYRKTKDQQKYKKAEEAYNSAIYANMRMFEPRYNSGQLLLVEYSPEDAQDQLAAARRYDLERFTRLSAYLEHGIVTVDARLSIVALLQKFTDTESLDTGLALARRLWKSGSRFDNPWYFSGVAFVLFLWAGLFGPTKGTPKKVAYCQMCGDPFTVKKRRRKRQRTDEEKEEKKSGNFCTQCTYIFKKKTTVKPEKRAQKRSQIQSRQQLRSLVARVSSLCLPGAGQIYYGYIGKGLLIACGFYLGFVLVLLKLFTKSLLTMEGSVGPSMVTIGFSIFLMAGTYLFNLYDVTKLSPKNQ